MDPLDSNKLRLYGVQTVEYVARYWEKLDRVAPLTGVQGPTIMAQLPQNAPDYPDEWHAIIKDVENIIMPGITHRHSPNCHAHFPGVNSYPGICADILANGFGCTGSSSWISSPGCTALVHVTLNWLGRMLQLPEDFLNTDGGTGGGLLQGSVSQSLHTVTMAARERALKKAKRDEEEAKNTVDVVSVDSITDLEKINSNVNFMHSEIVSYYSQDDTDGTSTIKFFAETAVKQPKPMKEAPPKDQPTTCIHEKLVLYASEEAHNWVDKACLMTSVICRRLPTDRYFSLRGETLEMAIHSDREDGNVPFMVIATLGTMSCISFDNLVEIGEIANREALWLHVDATYAGGSFVCPEFQHLKTGVEMADSINIDPHRWLQVNCECSALWLKDAESQEDVNHVYHEYMENVNGGNDIPDYRAALDDRFRALKVWFVLRMFGTEDLRRQIIERVRLAKEFEKLVKEDDRFELVGPNTLSVICFRLKGSNADNSTLCKKINRCGKIIISRCLSKRSAPPGVMILRFAISSPLTELKHVEAGWAEIVRHTDAISNHAHCRRRPAVKLR